MTKREKLAREMAEKSGYDFDKSNKMMQNAWLHNADTEINRTPESATVNVPAKIVIEDGVKAAEKMVVAIDVDIQPIADVDPLNGADSGTQPAEAEKNAAETPPAPKPGEYLCSRCNSTHRKNSNIGKKHLTRQ